jgi:hypothetical protein
MAHPLSAVLFAALSLDAVQLVVVRHSANREPASRSPAIPRKPNHGYGSTYPAVPGGTMGVGIPMSLEGSPGPFRVANVLQHVFHRLGGNGGKPGVTVANEKIEKGLLRGLFLI